MADVMALLRGLGEVVRKVFRTTRGTRQVLSERWLELLLGCLLLLSWIQGVRLEKWAGP